MAALTKNINTNYSDTQLRMQRSLPVEDNTEVWDGGCYGINATDELIVPTGSEKVVGFAIGSGKGKTITGNLNNDVVIIAFNMSAEIIVAGAINIDDPVYATNDGTFNVTTPSTSVVGVIVKILNATTGLCRVQVTCNA